MIVMIVACTIKQLLYLDRSINYDCNFVIYDPKLHSKQKRNLQS